MNPGGGGRGSGVGGRGSGHGGAGAGIPVVLSEAATGAGPAPGAHPGRGQPGRRGWRLRSLWVGVGPSCAPGIPTAAGKAPGAWQGLGGAGRGSAPGGGRGGVPRCPLGGRTPKK